MAKTKLSPGLLTGVAALGVLASWSFAVPYTYLIYKENYFKYRAAEGMCRIVDAALRDEGKGDCEETWIGSEITWEMPCKLDMEISHLPTSGINIESTIEKGSHDATVLGVDAAGTWVTFILATCTPGSYSYTGTYTPAKGPTCAELLPSRVNHYFACSYIPDDQGGIVDTGSSFGIAPSYPVMAAPLADLGAKQSLILTAIMWWAIGPIFAVAMLAVKKSMTTREAEEDDAEMDMLDGFDDEEDDE